MKSIGWRVTDLILRMDVLIDTPRLGHVPQHDLADLKGSFAKPDLQDFDIAPLMQRHG